ncbi:MAG: DUF3795 domain-containing protein [Candidatus Coatesbacteria bacterium]|nr:MAG: DUF3795 domain-containing protein [Candidatus Coatesbacteria bacterium]
MMESEKGLIGRCGIYCEACLIYGVSHHTEDVFVEKRRNMAEHFDCKPEQVACGGCQQLTDSSWGSACEILKCLNARGYGYCDECDGINECEKFAELDGRYGELKDSMARLREVGPDSWLAEQRDAMTCPGCGGALYYGFDGKCVVCFETG